MRSMLMTYVLLLPSPSGLQGLLNICAKFGLENDVEYNLIKSLCVVFKPRGFNLKCPDIYMNVNKLAYIKEAIYLGVIICNDLKDDGDILRHLRNFYTRTNSIIRNFHHCSVGVKLHLFHAYCCTTYCCQLWANFNKGSYLKLKLPTTICIDGFWDIADGTARLACLLIMLLIHLTPY